MDRRSIALLLAVLALAGNLLLTVIALTLGLHFEATPVALADSAKGQWIAVATVPGLVVAIVAIVAVVANRRNGRRPMLGLLAAAASLACALVALVIYLLVPGGTY